VIHQTLSTFSQPHCFGWSIFFPPLFLLCITSARDIDRCGARRRDNEYVGWPPYNGISVRNESRRQLDTEMLLGL
jgi:hypothetical protein